MLIEKAFIYRFLALAFSYPDWEVILELRSALPDLEKCLKTIGLNFPAEEVGKVLEESKGKLLDLQGEFTSLFETSLKAPARETSYELDKTARRSVEMADILGFYRAFGLELKAPLEPDNLVAELEFLSYLLQKAHQLDGEGKEISLDAYRKFLKDHLGRWFGVFCEKVMENTETDYYKVMAKLLKDFLELETRDLKVEKLTTYKKETLEGSTWKCGFME